MFIEKSTSTVFYKSCLRNARFISEVCRSLIFDRRFVFPQCTESFRSEGMNLTKIQKKVANVSRRIDQKNIYIYILEARGFAKSWRPFFENEPKMTQTSTEAIRKSISLHLWMDIRFFSKIVPALQLSPDARSMCEN